MNSDIENELRKYTKVNLVPNPSGVVRSCTLETKNNVYIFADKVTAIEVLKEGGPARIHLAEGSYLDVCGDANIWRCEVALAKLGLAND